MIQDKKEIIILTKSSKYGGLCVAGVDNNTGEWIRLVTKDRGQINRKIMSYEDGRSVAILDCVTVHTLGTAATSIQPENVYLDTSKHIEKIKTISMRELLEIHNLENHKTILGNNSHVIMSNVNMIGHSLEIVRVQNAILYEVIGSNGNCKAKLEFNYNNMFYQNMSVTDPEYFGVKNGTKLGEVILVISLPDDEYSKNHGYFKFIAKIFK